MEYDPELGGLKMNIKLQLAGHGLPAPPLSAAVVPIFPAPLVDDIDRRAIVTSPALPWDDCYVYTQERVTATVCRIYHEIVTGYQLSPEDHRAHLIAMIQDAPKFQDLRARLGVQDNGGGGGRNDNCSDDHGSRQDDDSSVANESALSDTVDSEVASNPGVADLMPFLIQVDSVPQMKINVELWLQADPTDELGSPSDYWATFRALKQCATSSLCLRRLTRLQD